MEERMTINDVLEQMYRLSLNREKVHELKKIVGKVPIPVYLNYEQYGNGMNYHLNKIAARMKNLDVVEMEIDSFLEYHAEYDEDARYSLAERLKRLLESPNEEAFAGVLLIHIDDWVDAGEVFSKEFVSAMRYMEEKRDRILLILQVNEEKVEDKDELEEFLAPFFNVKVVCSTPMKVSEMMEFVRNRLTQLHYKVNDEFMDGVEEICCTISKSEIMDQYHQIMLLLEDIVYEKIKTGEPGNMLDKKLLEPFASKARQMNCVDKARRIGFAAED